jgi:hypothetical protein
MAPSGIEVQVTHHLTALVILSLWVSFVCLCFLRLGPGSPQTCDPPASASQVLRSYYHIQQSLCIFLTYNSELLISRIYKGLCVKINPRHFYLSEYLHRSITMMPY